VWGWNGYHSLGNGTKTNSTGPELLLHGITDIATGGSHVIAKILRKPGKAEKFLVWGFNGHGQIATSERSSLSRPEKFDFKFPEEVSGFGCGWYHSFFILKDGSLYMCGKNVESDLGVGDSEIRDRPFLVPGITCSIPQASNLRSAWFIWEKIVMWFFLGRQDENSEFSKLPIEVVFHALNTIYF
jgi:alpha-tubulin suppressor-like RCC1 family protein